jgi:class 3 adenylate cyclase/tetratricopeptide (TPR) repeat protein
MLICRNCEGTNPDHARYCLFCGTVVLVLPNERRRVSVLFADIAGSTALIAGSDVEDARAVLGPVLQTMSRAVHRFDGQVYREPGDAILALFGAGVAYEDHARRACLAALSMQAEVPFCSPDPARGNTGPIRIRVGIASGEVLLRSVTTDLHTERSADGVTTHIAAKAQQAAGPGSILVTAEVAWLVDGLIETRAHKPILLGGSLEPVRLFELVKATNVRSRFQAAIGRGLGRFVGRVHEIERLDRAAELAHGGAARAVGVVGEAGVGKSRLLWEFKRQLQARGWTVLTAHSTICGARSSYFPVLSVLKSMYQLEPDDDPTAISLKLTRSPGGGALAVDLPPLLVLLDQAVDEPNWYSLDASKRRERTNRALTSLLLEGAKQKATAILIDDLHEADSETREFLNRLTDRLGEERLLLMLEYRPGHGPELNPGNRFELLPVEPLAENIMVEMFRQLAGEDSSLARLQRVVVDRVAGNPFFIEESIRMLSEAGFLRGSAGDYRAVGSNQTIPIPASVKNVLEARIALLPKSDREVLQLAAVIGKDVSILILQGIADRAQGELVATLTRLVEAALLVLTPIRNTHNYAFKHAFTQEMAYESIGRAERKATHARIVRLVEAQAIPALAERVELLAHHALKAGDCDRAVGYLQQAAQRAVERSALREAVRLLDEALAIVPSLSIARTPDDCEIDLRLTLRVPLLALGNLRRVADEVHRLVLLTPKCTQPMLQGRLAVVVCGHLWITGRLVSAIEAGRRAIAIAGPANDLSLLVPARQYVGGALHAMGQYAEAQEMLTANILCLQEDELGHRFGMAGLPAVFCRSARAWSHEHLGNFEAAESDVFHAMRISGASGHGFSILSACFNAGSFHFARGEFAEAELLFSNALNLCKAERLRMWLPMLGPMLALVLAKTNRIDTARKLIDETVPSPEDPLLTTFIMLNIAEVYMAISRIETAERLATAALHRAEKCLERIWEATARRLLAEIGGQRETPIYGEVEFGYRAALTLGENLGMRPLAARCRLGLASVFAGQGELGEAVQQLDRANAEFTSMGLSYWSDQTSQVARRFNLPV